MTAPRRAARAPPSSQCRSAALNQTGLAATPGDQVIRWQAAPVSPSTARPMPSRSPSRRRAADVMSGAPFAAISIDGAAVSAVLPLATAGEDFTLKGLGAFPAGSPAFGSGDQCRCRRLGAAVPVRLFGTRRVARRADPHRSARRIARLTARVAGHVDRRASRAAPPPPMPLAMQKGPPDRSGGPFASCHADQRPRAGHHSATGLMIICTVPRTLA